MLLNLEVFMPIISTFMYCENANQVPTPQGDKLNIIGPMHIFKPTFVPGNFSFSIVCGILELNTEHDHVIRIKFINNQTEEVLVDTGDFNFPGSNDPKIIELPEDMRGVMLNLDFRNVILRNTGSYTTEVIVDNEFLGQFPVKVLGSETL